jgi:hypothetical protein
MGPPSRPERASAAGDPPEVAAARRAAEAALAAGTLDRLQAEALVALAGRADEALMVAARRTLAGELSEATRSLVRDTEAAAARLEDLEAATDLEELAGVIADLGQTTLHLRARAYQPGGPAADRLLAPETWLRAVDAATRHLREARDLLDDGMPADTAAFAVLAAREALSAAL